MKKTFYSLLTMLVCAFSFIAHSQVIPVCSLNAKFEFKTDNCFVKFADLSATGKGTTITNWHWDFGDGTSSTLQNPTHAYTTNGTYTVCLTIVGKTLNGLQCKDKFCLPVTIRGCGNPEPCKVVPKFDYKIDKCTVYFTDYSGAGTGTTITSWYWDFGDGNTSTSQHPTHVYAANGTYKVCLTIVGVNAAGQKCKDILCLPVIIDGCGDVKPCGVKPLFDFKVDKCTVYFTDKSGTNTGTTITNWYWNFGDGNTSTVQHPTHTYAANGTYTVCLITVAVNAAGQQCKNEYCFRVKIDGCGDVHPCGVKPLFDFKIDKCTVYFIDKSGTNPGTTITNWYWSFGDGNTSTAQHPTHTYAANGTYTVCLITVAVNAAGERCKNEYCFPVTIEGCGQAELCKLAAKFDYKVEGCTVYFTDYSATGTGTTITNWYWDFGDGNTSTLQNPAHTYVAPGNYVVCLIIVGVNPLTGEQCKDKICLEVPVKECDPSHCLVYPKFDYKAEKCTVYFTDYSGAGAGTTITNWYWTFGDGNTSTLQNPTHTYTASGVYTVCLTVVGVNAKGEQCKDRYCLEIKVDGCGDPQPCKVGAKFDYKVDGCTVYFTDYSATATGTTITNWYWDFGDGNTSTLQNPTHTYGAPGNYLVCLVIVGVNPATGEQCKDRLCLEVSVKECDPLHCLVYPKFDYKVEKCTVYFTDYSGTGAGTTITNWYWTFGDGNTSTLQNPTHTYATAGVYTVCLTVVGVNAKGEQCKDRYCVQIKVDGCGDPQPCKVGAKFDYKADKCTVYFTDFSGAGAGTTITNWYWEFGDGSTANVQNPVHSYTAAGGYLVCLTVVGVNANGEECKDRYCVDIKVEGCEQSIPCGLSARFDQKADNCTVNFNDLSFVTTGTDITGWSWDFGDGQSSTLRNPSHTYKESGNYYACLTITGVSTYGVECKDTYCVNVDVENCNTLPCGVFANFSYTSSFFTVNFKDLSTVTTGTVITSWYWDFGDGNTSTLKNPTNYYASVGTFEVCLTVTGINYLGLQCTDMICMEVTVDFQRPSGISDKQNTMSALQVYPNPARDIVNMQFNLQTAGQVIIAITDVQGRIISVVRDGNMAEGIHTVSWNPDVRPGLYFVTIRTAAGTEQMQLIIQH